MKNFNVKVLLLTNMLLLINLLIGCDKEKVIISNQPEQSWTTNASDSGAQSMTIPDAAGDNGELTEREDGFEMAPVYPNYNGDCRLIFMVRGFNPAIPHGGGGKPCPHSDLLYRGYSQPNAQGTLLFPARYQLPEVGRKSISRKRRM